MAQQYDEATIAHLSMIQGVISRIPTDLPVTLNGFTAAWKRFEAEGGGEGGRR